MKCPECGSTDVETLWVQPKQPREPYQKWWCLGCGVSGVVDYSEESVKK